MAALRVPELHPAATPLVHDFLEQAARRQPDKEALVCGPARLSYRELDGQANALARTLVAGGVARGDRVLVFADNSVESAVAVWATLKANAVVSLVNPLTKADKLTYLLNDSRASALVTDMPLAPVVARAVPQAPALGQTIVAGDFAAGRLPGVPNLLPWREAVAGDRSAPPPRRAIDVDLAAIIYTSGSTGEPKGVMLSHRNVLTAATSISTYLELQEDDVVLNVLPLAFDYGLYQMLMAFRAGGRLVLERSFAYPAQVLNLIAREKVTGFPGVPTIFAVLAEMRTLKDFDLSSIRFVTNTAAALPVKHIKLLRSLFPEARIYSMYGLTECKRCSYLPPADLDRKPDSVGIAIPNTELWIADEAGNRLGPHQVGQLVIRGATVMKGYWGKPEATAEKLRPDLISGEQVLYTGDIGRMDDIIKSRGEKVAPKEVETVLTDLPGVREVAVIGVPDPVLGQAIKAFVVCDEGVTLTVTDLVRECQQRLESFMVPKHLEIVAALPKTGTGKINKRVLQ